MAGYKSKSTAGAQTVRSALDAVGFSYLPFADGALSTFAMIRSQTRLKVADAIHLASAAAAGIDLFLTGDKQLVGMHVPGIQFIADFNSSIL